MAGVKTAPPLETGVSAAGLEVRWRLRRAAAAGAGRGAAVALRGGAFAAGVQPEVGDSAAECGEDEELVEPGRHGGRGVEVESLG